ncbi:MAG: DUF4921 family protein [Euryarchaeota archaeon]|nr:DUF4921 family protein [Euryarchaeota archaeon]
MPELRKHYFLDEWVLVATERSKRPTDFAKARPPAPSGACPFCPGQEEKTPPATAAYVKKGEGWEVRADGAERVRGWSVRVFPNLYPAVGPEQGLHEVIAETPDHPRHPSDLRDPEAELLFRAYAERCRAARQRPGTRYVSLFRNHRSEAGASLAHPHSQLISLPVLPPALAREQNAMGKNCAYCRIAREEAQGPRLVLRREGWVAFCPIAPRKPYEIWVVPEVHVPTLEMLEGATRDSLARLTRDLLLRIKDLLGDPPYNYHFLQQPGGYHLNLRIQPELTLMAGFEKNTDIYINPVPPENAAQDLRNL